MTTMQDTHPTCKLCQGVTYARQCRHSAAWRLAQFGDADHECHRGIEIGFLADEGIGDYAPDPISTPAPPTPRAPCVHERAPRLDRPCCGDRFMCALLDLPVTGTHCRTCSTHQSATTPIDRTP